MIKQSLLALAASASVLAVAAPTPAVARHHYRHHHYTRVYQGNNGRYNCRRGNGVQGTIVGAGAGALLGAAVTHGAAGPIIGAVGGGLAGHSIGTHRVTCR